MSPDGTLGRSARRMIAAIAVAVLAPVGVNAQVLPSQLSGRVVTPSRVAIAAVELTELSTGSSTTSDSLGKFRIILEPGAHVLRVRRIGYQSELFRVNLDRGQRQDVEIVLRPGAYELPTLEVTARQAKPIEYAWTTRFDDFFHRRHVGLGHFLTRQDIEKANAFRTPNLLSTIGGIHLQFLNLGPTGTAVSFARCSGLTGSVAVWINGFKQRLPTAPSREQAVGEFQQQYPPSQIEMMEVYRGPAEMPAEFNDGDCGAIVLWTR